MLHCMKPASFQKAVPIWEKGTESEKNLTLVFSASVPGKDGLVLKIAGHSQYTVLVNGEFLWFGPARAGHGYYRVEEVALDGKLKKAENRMEILVQGTNVNSFSLLDKPAFLCAEILDGEIPIIWTATDGAFVARRMTERIQKVTRYSFQRTFNEAYRMENVCAGNVELAEMESKKLIAREIPIPEFPNAPLKKILTRGAAVKTPGQEEFHDRMIDNVDNKIFKGFCVDELEFFPARVVEQWAFVPEKNEVQALAGGESVFLPANTYVIGTFGKELTGLIGMTVECEEDTQLLLTFDEILQEDGSLNWHRMNCNNIVSYELKGGERYELLTLEPYSLQYLQMTAIGGAATISNVSMRRIEFPMGSIHRQFKGEDVVLRRISDAAVSTFVQNSFDIFMDCPSRERAGWLCDSFFTARTEYTLTGKAQVERNFLANFLMSEEYPRIADGMLPMCYPSDHYKGGFIPNWAMWFVLELYEYVQRSGDISMAEDAKPRVYALLNYFRKFENADGLLEKLEKWVFIEWSKANDLVQDINYPTNMLYTMMKRRIAALYADESLLAEADSMKRKIREQSKTGLFYCDNAVYDEDGVAKLSGLCTESCQYYAFFTDIATPEEDRELWQILLNEFGPDRKEKGAWPEIFPANAFIGNYLRLDLLDRFGEHVKLKENIAGYFDYMALETGTLWEHVSTIASCNHGFASHVLYWLDHLGYLETTNEG